MEINPREIAAQALVEITGEGAYNTILLRQILKQNGAMSRQNRAFVTEVVNGSLRNLIYLDYVLNQVSSVPTTKMKPWVLAVLRSAVYQILFMDKVPPAAACNEAVSLIQKRGMGKLSGFVNGVLRTIVREGAPALPDREAQEAGFLSLKYSHPIWLVKLWLSGYGSEFTEALLVANNTTPVLTIGANPLKTTVQALKTELEAGGILVEPGLFHPNALRLKKTSDLTKLPAFLEGKFHVQDESSMTAVSVLDPKPGERILDVCAAPGGKSILAAEKMDNCGEVLSRDIYPHKLTLLEDMAGRLGISIIQTQAFDATTTDESLLGTFDKVIVDAPCTGFGLIRKKPDMKYHRTGNDIDSLSALQKEILAAAAGYVRPGGVLVYSTCTLCKKENIANVTWFLNHYPYELEDITPYLPEGLVLSTAKEGYGELYPHIHGTDGFFIARLVRKEA